MIFNYDFTNLSFSTNKFAKIVPDIECHTQETAEIIAASGIKAKCFVAKTVAKPAFCIPTSIDMVLF